MNDLDDPSGTYCHQLIEDAAEFDEKWYDWKTSKIKKYIEDNSKNDFVFVQFSYKELGKTNRWFKKQCRGLNNDLLKIKRELLLQWTLTGDTCPFSEEQITEMENYVKFEPIGKFYIFNKYKFNIYKEMHNLLKKSWLIGIDVGGGLSGDFSVITVAEPSDRTIVAQFRSNTISVPDLAKLVEKLVTDYFPNGVIIPERNSLGISLIQLLLTSSVSNRIYYEVKTVKGQKIISDPKDKHNGIRNNKKQTRVYGINTDKDTRKIMIDEILNSAVNDEPWLITSPVTFNEIKTLERDKKGKIQHKQGFHDDSLFSWLVLSYALLYGKNINKFVKCTSDGIKPIVDEHGNKIINNKNAINIKRLFNNINSIKPSTEDKSISDIFIEKSKEIENVNKEFSYENDLNKRNKNNKMNNFMKIINMNK